MVNTNPQLIEEILTRGVEQIFPKREVLETALASGKRLRLYCGFDPSATSLHIGNAILINKLRQFQELGHEIIFLVGDFTGMIGDPTDKSATRKQLTREEVLANAKSYQEQAGHYLDFSGDNPAQVKYNSEWQDKLTFKDLISIATNFTVGQMLARDMFQKRIAEEKPIFMHEFLYPLAQGYDSVAMEVDLEIGGNDQMFNMLCGRDLSKNILNKEKCVMTMKLLADADGNKMGKTAGNAVFLDASANDIYGAVMSWSDGVILPAWELATTSPMAKINEVKERLANGENPKNLKLELAIELVALFCGAESATAAAEHFRLAVSEKTAPADLPKVELLASEDLFTAVVKFYNGQRSNTQIRQLFSDKAVYYNNQPTDDGKLLPKSGSAIRVGKKDWFEIG
ncbi:tyrosine--tRNA ligase [Candidatus Falkowbacteria bacterium CG10_big_fil_rev_8_21_14_0_10_37_14]|uniref:Tyrosine--tRNA ligase n=1 Tax=Candidatus Falkowbacteria bacterium CG10_big_fil_rev_8_21_14_0_10_37_14 TaxID=1974561 RepID=A0A2M6WSZ6_9BACT|nr:tyrosine--tRNA ligase [Candidatus Falkowbacteria bacterium]PIT95871.1 MAG: tyrosine--tRNA ligase [Candidatus Falkowbacteria bacterium CG10_big_fil_rev_8_21_14_0_10_37_14]